VGVADPSNTRVEVAAPLGPVHARAVHARARRADRVAR